MAILSTLSSVRERQKHRSTGEQRWRRWPAGWPSLALFLIGGALIGAGSGAVFKGTTGIVLEASPPESRVAMTSDLLIALYVGLSVPVIGAGVALDLGASAPNTVLGFAVLVGLGVAVTGWALLRRRP
jgi:MFS family permease